MGGEIAREIEYRSGA